MPRNYYTAPKYKPILIITNIFRVLADVRRWSILNVLAEHGKPVGFKQLRKMVNVPASTLSKILQRYESVGLVTRTTHFDRTQTITVNRQAVKLVTGELMRVHRGLEKEAVGEAKAGDTAPV